MKLWKRIVIIILCVAAAVGIGFYAVHAVKSIRADKSVRAEALEKIRKQNEGTLPVIPMGGAEEQVQKTAHYKVLVTDSSDVIGPEIAEFCDYYGIAYTLDASDFDPKTRTCNGVRVYGSFELSIKQDLTAAISAGEDFYIGVGQNDDKDFYSAANIEAMCLFLLDYIDTGSLEELTL